MAWDNLSIRVINICGKSITYQFNLYLKHCCKKELSQDVGKKLMLCQCSKRKIKTYQKNADLLVYCWYLEKYLREYFSKIYLTTFKKVNFLHNASSDFYPVILAFFNHSCYLLFAISILLLLTVIHLLLSEMYFDISKTYEKVWPDRIIFKLETNGVKGKLLNLIKNSLKSLCTLSNGSS